MNINKNTNNTSFSRNYPFISDNLQQTCHNSRLLIAGCGLGANIALLAARTGFRYFTILDFDTVEKHNLNRQPYFIEDLNSSKVKTLEQVLTKISPAIEVESIEKKIEEVENLSELIEKSGIIVNTIDLYETESKNIPYWELSLLAVSIGKYVFLPFNVGYGSVLIVVPPTRQSLEIIKKKLFSIKEDFMLIIKLLKNSIMRYRIYTPFLIYALYILDKIPIPKPSYKPYELLRILWYYKERIEELDYNPQLGIASHISSALTVNKILEVLNNSANYKEPNFTWIDIRHRIFYEFPLRKVL